jgi:hypothetical protein
MYLVHLKAMVVNGLRQTFGGEYPNEKFRNVHVGIEYPVDEQAYPGIWVDYEDTAALTRAGIDHKEIDGPNRLPQSRFRFQGALSFTIVALTSLERDALYDEMIRVIAFGDENADTLQFRRYVEDNPLIAANINTDEIQAHGNAAAPGTPWGTEEIIYERGITVDVLGEFQADPISGTLVPLTRIEIVQQTEYLAEAPALPPGAWL